ncbi:tyrosine-type recombinase/integrase [Mycobacterium sp. AT1]|uniref:tyrosine-type recombinase/integrase n=1 Tax=Mycobacterium sp. AT1 TaxID=1961706 RepID=UPI0009AE94B6|nr:tyrosine-type recombinase/integrase [Mycobacterium sp. AT1]OPX12840.1 site-specific integrase [Mycobacterium sp. AT1]
MYVRLRESKRRDSRGRPIRRYQAVWTEDGRRHTETFNTRELAEDKLDAVKTLLAKGQSPASLRERGAETFAVVAAHWLATRHDLKPRTLAGYREMLTPAAERNRDMRALGIDAVFGSRAVNDISRADIAEWVGKLTDAGKSASTVRHHYYVLKQVLAQAVADDRIIVNPADHVKLPTERSVSGGTPGVADDPDMYLTAAQVAALVDATPWPCSALVATAAWSGLRAAELAGLQIGDIELPPLAINPNAPAKPGALHVQRTVISADGALTYDTPKTKGSRRRVPLTSATTALLRDFIADHPRGDDPSAPLFPNVRLTAIDPPSPNGSEASSATTSSRRDPEHWRIVAQRQARTLAGLSVDHAAQRLELDWSQPLRHMTFYKSVFRPSVLRANRLAGSTDQSAPDAAPLLPPGLKFHALRHTYASLCVAAGIAPLDISRFMGHSRVTTTLAVYAHLFDSDHADSMAALEAMSTPTDTTNVVRLRRRG